MRHYIEATKIDGGFVGRIYKYDRLGNKEITVWKSSIVSSEPETIDLAYGQAEVLELDIEL